MDIIIVFRVYKCKIMVFFLFFIIWVLIDFFWGCEVYLVLLLVFGLNEDKLVERYVW